MKLQEYQDKWSAYVTGSNAIMNDHNGKPLTQATMASLYNQLESLRIMFLHQGYNFPSISARIAPEDPGLVELHVWGSP